MKTLIGKNGLKSAQVEEIKAVIRQVNPRGGSWTAGYLDIQAMLAKAEAKLEAAKLPLSYRAGATAIAYTASPSRAYKYAVRGNTVHLRRLGKEWRVVEIKECHLHAGSNLGSSVNVALTPEEVGKIQEMAVAGFSKQSPKIHVTAFGSLDALAEGYNRKAPGEWLNGTTSVLESHGSPAF